MKPRITSVLVGSSFLVVAICAIAAMPLVRLARIARSAHATHPKTGAPLLVPGREGDSTVLFNGWRIRPAGRQIPIGDMPVGGAISPDGTVFAIANAGYGPHRVNIIDLATEKIVAEVPVTKAWD